MGGKPSDKRRRSQCKTKEWHGSASLRTLGVHEGCTKTKPCGATFCTGSGGGERDRGIVIGREGDESCRAATNKKKGVPTTRLV